MITFFCRRLRDRRKTETTRRCKDTQILVDINLPQLFKRK